MSLNRGNNFYLQFDVLPWFYFSVYVWNIRNTQDRFYQRFTIKMANFKIKPLSFRPLVYATIYRGWNWKRQVVKVDAKLAR